MKNLALSLALIVLVAGCTDSLLTDGGERTGTNQETVQADKFRHAELMNRATRPATGVAGKDGEGLALGLVMKISEQKILERYAILERYKLMERYRLMERYEYDDAFAGFAIEVEDAAGENDFSDFLTTMSMDPDIEWFEPDFGVTSPDGSTQGQKIPWSIVAVGGHVSSTVSGDGQGSVEVDVYVLDTGVSNADLNIVESLDFTGDSPGDVDGHGSHVAGIIGAIDDNRGLVGIAPGARIHNFKVLGDDGTADVSSAIAAMDVIIGRKVESPTTPIVINMSLGENVGSTAMTALDVAVQRAIDVGVTVVIASGNQGVETAFVTPAHVADAITVGAFDQDGYLAAFSNYGPLVDILAPGTDIISLAPGEGVGSPVRMTGTSMAAPHVAGGAALYLAANPTATPAEVRAQLIANALPGVLLSGNTTDLRLWVGNF